MYGRPIATARHSGDEEFYVARFVGARGGDVDFKLVDKPAAT
jgi:hypothetical protein